MDNKSIGTLGETPEQEDRALFKTYGGPIEVEIIPHFQRPKKHLFLAKGYFDRTTEVIAVFSGRRVLETKPLSQYLAAMESAARRQAVARRALPPNLDEIRLPVQIKGSWQYKFYPDATGDEFKVFELLVARWAFTDQRGVLHQFGEAPAYDVKTRRRNKSYILQSRDVDAVPRESRLGSAPE